MAGDERRRANGAHGRPMAGTARNDRTARIAGPGAGGAAAGSEDHLARRELVPLLLRCRRHRGAPRDLPGAAARGSTAASDPRRRAGAQRPPRGRLGGDDVPRHVLGRAQQPLRLQGRRQLHQSEIAPRHAEDQWRRRSRRLELHLADGAARRRAARRGRHATVQRGCAFRHSLSGRVGGQRRDRRPRGGDREGRRQGSARRRHGRQLRLRRGQSRRAGALLARSQRRLRQRARPTGISPATRRASARGNRSATKPSSRRTPAGPIRAATARSIRISCARPCSSAWRTIIAPSPTSASPARARR